MSIVLKVCLISVVVTTGWSHLMPSESYCRTRVCDPGTHVMCKYGKKKVGKACKSLAPGKFNEAHKNQILNEINTKRANLVAGNEIEIDNTALPRGYGMSRVFWDDELARFAEVWVNQCIDRTDECRNTLKYRSVYQWISYTDRIFVKDSMTNEDIESSITAIFFWFWGLRGAVALDLISNYEPRGLGRQNQVYLNMMFHRHTAVGCGMASMGLFQSKKVYMVCNFSNRLKDGDAVYPTVKPPHSTINCGCPSHWHETADCLCMPEEYYYEYYHISSSTNKKRTTLTTTTHTTPNYNSLATNRSIERNNFIPNHETIHESDQIIQPYKYDQSGKYIIPINYLQPAQNVQPAYASEPAQINQLNYIPEPVHDVQPNYVPETLQDVQTTYVTEAVQEVQTNYEYEPFQDVHSSYVSKPVENIQPVYISKPVLNDQLAYVSKLPELAQDVQPNYVPESVQDVHSNYVHESIHDIQPTSVSKSVQNDQPNYIHEPVQDAHHVYIPKQGQNFQPANVPDRGQNVQPISEPEPLQDVQPAYEHKSGYIQPAYVAETVQGVQPAFVPELGQNVQPNVNYGQLQPINNEHVQTVNYNQPGSNEQPVYNNPNQHLREFTAYNTNTIIWPTLTTMARPKPISGQNIQTIYVSEQGQNVLANYVPEPVPDVQPVYVLGPVQDAQPNFVPKLVQDAQTNNVPKLVQEAQLNYLPKPAQDAQPSYVPESAQDVQPNYVHEPVQDHPVYIEKPVQNIQPVYVSRPVQNDQPAYESTPVQDVQPNYVSKSVQNAQPDYITKSVQYVQPDYESKPVQNAQPDYVQPVQNVQPDNVQSIQNSQPDHEPKPVQNVQFNYEPKPVQNAQPDYVQPVQNVQPDNVQSIQNSQPDHEPKPVQNVQPNYEPKPVQNAQPDYVQPVQNVQPDNVQSIQNSQPDHEPKPVQNVQPNYEPKPDYVQPVQNVQPDYVQPVQNVQPAYGPEVVHNVPVNYGQLQPFNYEHNHPVNYNQPDGNIQHNNPTQSDVIQNEVAALAAYNTTTVIWSTLTANAKPEHFYDHSAKLIEFIKLLNNTPALQGVAAYKTKNFTWIAGTSPLPVYTQKQYHEHYLATWEYSQDFFIPIFSLPPPDLGNHVDKTTERKLQSGEDMFLFFETKYPRPETTALPLAIATEEMNKINKTLEIYSNSLVYEHKIARNSRYTILDQDYLNIQRFDVNDQPKTESDKIETGNSIELRQLVTKDYPAIEQSKTRFDSKVTAGTEHEDYYIHHQENEMENKIRKEFHSADFYKKFFDTTTEREYIDSHRSNQNAIRGQYVTESNVPDLFKKRFKVKEVTPDSGTVGLFKTSFEVKKVTAATGNANFDQYNSIIEKKEGFTTESSIVTILDQPFNQEDSEILIRARKYMNYDQHSIIDQDIFDQDYVKDVTTESNLVFNEEATTESDRIDFRASDYQGPHIFAQIKDNRRNNRDKGVVSLLNKLNGQDKQTESNSNELDFNRRKDNVLEAFQATKLSEYDEVDEIVDFLKYKTND